MDDFFLRYFPPPAYLAMPALGVDISDRSLKYAELVTRNARLELGRYGTKTLPEGLIQSGEIKNKEGLVAFLKTSLEPLRGAAAILALPEERAYVRLISLPALPEESVRETLELQLEEHFPLSSVEAVFDYEILRRPYRGDHLDVVAVAFPRTLAESYRNVVKEAGLRPLVFEMEAQAVARAIMPPEEREVVMVVDFGRTRSSFSIVTEGVVRFTSTVSVAGEALDKALAQAFKIDIFEAERLKKERGLVRTAENKEVFAALLPVVSAIRDEITRHLTFWKNHAEHVHLSDPEVGTVYLCGGDANLTGLWEYLSYELRLPVKLANPWVNITDFEEYIPEIKYNEALSYATSLGLALRAETG